MRGSRFLTGRAPSPPYVANLDSSTTLLRATARYLRGEDFPRLGMIPRSLEPLVRALNYLPRRWRQQLYTWSGVSETVSPDRLDEIRVEAIRRWAVERYPTRGYPAVMIGSANGAAVHLAALLGIPWLPQTFVIPVRRTIPAGAGTADLEWGREPGRKLLAENPDIRLHQMHDPNQDRLLIERMAYFRVKSLALGEAYERFLETVLAPGGTIILVECARQWPTTAVDDRHVFQFGGIGGLTPEEYHEGGETVEEFLQRGRDSPSRWDPPEPDDERPEAEWGFEPALRADSLSFADERGYDVRRLRFDHPQELSPPVADLYREHYEERGISADRLLVESFALVSPWWSLRTGTVPYWVPFNTTSDADSVEDYLSSVSEPYEELALMLISHGLDSAGMASIDRWQSLIEAPTNGGEFVGVDPGKYPIDLGTYARYRTELSDSTSIRFPLPPPVSLDSVDGFLADASRQYGVRWITE